MKIFSKLKELTQRNIPIIVIALITVVVFIFVIIISSRTETETPSLIILDEEQRRELDLEPISVPDDVQDLPEEEAQLTQYEINASKRSPEDREIAENSANPQDVDTDFRAFDIEYTLQGFEPGVASVIENQQIKIKNNTTRTININPVFDKFSEFENGITIGPNQIFNLRLYKTKLWTVEEAESKHRLFFMVSDYPYD